MDFGTRGAFLFISITLLAACGPADRAESIMPEKTETCGGAALKNNYIVRFKTGHWHFVENSSREDFKETFVRPNLDEIDFIEHDQIITTRIEKKSRSATSGIDNWGAQAIYADRFWRANQRGQDIVVAVVDTGVDVSHPQLASQIFINSGEAGPLSNNGIDDDNNGFIDDVYGYSFYDNSNLVHDTEGHGTHVAGVISANHFDTEVRSGYVQGIAPGAKILPVKFLGARGGTLSAALKGIDYAAARGAKVINASWGGPGCSQSLRQKMSDLIAQNILFVVAAGNSGVNLDKNPEYPAAFNLPLQLTVGALSERLNLDYYSNYSTSLVHIFAPGSGIVSTMPDGGYASLSGTSMATPFVSAAAALIMAARPDFTLSQVRSAILTHVETDTHYLNTSKGRMNLDKLANALGL